MRPWSPVPLLIAAVVLLVVVSPVAGTLGQQQLDPNGSTIEIQVRPNGDADIAVTTAFQLDGQNDTEAFDRLADRFERGEVAAYSATPLREAATAADRTTDREMRIEGVEYTARTAANGSLGVLSIEVTWIAFASVQEDTIVVRDAFNTTNGTWLPSLRDDQRLVIRPPQGYSIDSAPVGPRDRVLVWEGPTTFQPGDIFVTYIQQREVTSTTPLTDGSESPGSPGPTSGGVDQWVLTGGFLLLVAVLALAGYVFSRRDRQDGSTPTSDGGVDGSSGASASAAAASPDEDDDIDPELLSDEERVERLLRRNGGRMKQATIVTETGWSNAKVSQLLSGMSEAGRVEKLRIGRENLISLPDEE